MNACGNVRHNLVRREMGRNMLGRIAQGINIVFGLGHILIDPGALSAGEPSVCLALEFQEFKGRQIHGTRILPESAAAIGNQIQL